MGPSPLLSSADVDRLLDQAPITDRHPWASGEEHQVEGHLRRVLADVERSTRTLSRVEWAHYGSGYASFVDAWLYRPTPAFDAKRTLRHGEEHTGLVVLLSRLSPYFVFMEGEKHWHARGSGSYLPGFDLLDRLDTPAVASLAEEVEPVLQAHGLIRARRGQLEEPLASGVHVPTILTDRGFNQFDALFHWED